MKTSALKLCTALAIAAASSVGLAQQATDANPAGGYSSPTVNPSTGQPYGTADVYRPGYPATYYPGNRMNRNCAGLSDRETERACREGFTVEHSDVPLSATHDSGGKTDDQAN